LITEFSKLNDTDRFKLAVKSLKKWFTSEGGIAQLLASNARSSLHLRPKHSIIPKRAIVSGINASKQSVEKIKAIFQTILHYARRYFPWSIPELVMSKIRKY